MTNEAAIQERAPEPHWVRPDIKKEKGEIARVIGQFLKIEVNGKAMEDLAALLEAAPLVELSDEEWAALENTDSYDNVRPGSMEDVRAHVDSSNAELEIFSRRDVDAIEKGFREGLDMEAPIILRKGERFHLVSGNTRLMVARALGVRPQAVMGTMHD